MQFIIFSPSLSLSLSLSLFCLFLFFSLAFCDYPSLSLSLFFSFFFSLLSLSLSLSFCPLLIQLSWLRRSPVAPFIPRAMDDFGGFSALVGSASAPASPTSSAMAGSSKGDLADKCQNFRHYLPVKPPLPEPGPLRSAESAPIGPLSTISQVLAVGAADDVLECKRMLVVSGLPGSGKSNALFHAAVLAARDGCYLPLPSGTLAHSYRDLVPASERIGIETIHCPLGIFRQADIPVHYSKTGVFFCGAVPCIGRGRCCGVASRCSCFCFCFGLDIYAEALPSIREGLRIPFLLPRR